MHPARIALSDEDHPVRFKGSFRSSYLVRISTVGRGKQIPPGNILARFMVEIYAAA